MRPIYIFDLDGTLALIDHRRHHVEGVGKKDWRAFFAACVDDAPNTPVIGVMSALIHCQQRFNRPEIWIFSGRSDEVATVTIEWLRAHTYWEPALGDRLRMRAEGNYTPDHALKKQWLDEMTQSERDRLVCVFDDRKQVVDMWRANGVTCLQVADGDF